MANTILTEEIRLTYEDYAKLPNDGHRYELVDGELFMSPAPKPKHERVQINLFLILRSFIERHNLGELFVAPLDVVLDEHTVMQPDLFFITRGRLSLVGEVNIQGPPDLVIEVESDYDSRADWVKKLKAYDRFGVKEVWYVRPSYRNVEVRRRVGDRLELVARLSGIEKLTSPLFRRFRIPLKKIWV